MKPTGAEAKGISGGAASPFARRRVAVSPAELVRAEELRAGQALPLLLRPAADGVDLARWAEASRDLIREKLRAHGGLLFRGFGVGGVEEFERFVRAVSEELLEYRERSSPRTALSGGVYTSTEYPAGKRIFLHNENSYQHVFPLKILFHCVTPPARGGQTPIADCRRVLRHIPREVLSRFREKGWMLVRNFREEVGLPWQTVFQTTDRSEVERYCEGARIGVEWRGDSLRTTQVRPAVATHPRTGEEVWFNHAAFFHFTTLEAASRLALAARFSDEELPNNTYYGDGSPIEPEVAEQLREAYARETVMFDWQRGDVLMLDNMLVAHAREPFSGERKIVVAMSDPATRDAR